MDDEERVARALGLVQHPVYERGVRAHEVDDDKGVVAVPEREAGAVDRPPGHPARQRADEVVEGSLPAAAQVVVARDDEERQVAEAPGAGRLGVSEHLELDAVVGAVALYEVADRGRRSAHMSELRANSYLRSRRSFGPRGTHLPWYNSVGDASKCVSPRIETVYSRPPTSIEPQPHKEAFASNADEPLMNSRLFCILYLPPFFIFSTILSPNSPSRSQ